eukprot:jgi/Chrzof1/7967/UNPLg00027.t1
MVLLLLGTSVGSIIALYLADRGTNSHPYFKRTDPQHPERAGGAKGAKEAILREGTRIFAKPWYNYGLFSPLYPAKGIEDFLQQVFCEGR